MSPGDLIRGPGKKRWNSSIRSKSLGNFLDRHTEKSHLERRVRKAVERPTEEGVKGGAGLRNRKTEIRAQQNKPRVAGFK